MVRVNAELVFVAEGRPELRTGAQGQTGGDPFFGKKKLRVEIGKAEGIFSLCINVKVSKRMGILKLGGKKIFPLIRHYVGNINIQTGPQTYIRHGDSRVKQRKK
jgi:hypothetical protein